MQFQQHGSYCNENIPNPVNLLSIDQQNLFSAIISGQLERVCCVSESRTGESKTGVSRRYSKNLKRLEPGSKSSVLGIYNYEKPALLGFEF